MYNLVDGIPIRTIRLNRIQLILYTGKHDTAKHGFPKEYVYSLTYAFYFLNLMQ